MGARQPSISVTRVCKALDIRRLDSSQGRALVRDFSIQKVFRVDGFANQLKFFCSRQAGFRDVGFIIDDEREARIFDDIF